MWHTPTLRRTALGIAFAAALAMAAVSLRADAVDPDDATVAALRDGLQSFADDALADLVGLPPLNDVLPLTSADPAGPDGLGLGSLLSDVLDALPTGDVSGLQAALEGLDATYGGNVAVTVGCPAPATSGCEPVQVTVDGDAADPDAVSLVLPIRAVADMQDLPLDLPTDVTHLHGGALDATAELATTLSFHLDMTAPDPAASLVLASAPTVTIGGAFATSATTWSLPLGFTDVTAAVSGLTSSLSYQIAFADPDSVAPFSRDEWTATAIEDLVTVTPSGALAGSLTVDSGLTTASPDLTLSLADDLSDGFDAPTLTAAQLGPLAPFTEVSPSSVISGLAQLAAGISGAEGATATALPFLQGTLADAYDAAGPLFDFLRQQAVVCGTERTAPPTGLVDQLGPGDSIYCQVHTGETATSVTWSAVSSNVTFDAIVDDDDATGPAATQTVGSAATAWARFDVTGDGPIEVRAAWSFTPSGGGGPVAVQSELPPRTAQELAADLAALAGFDAAALTPNWDPATRALTFGLQRSIGAATVAVPVSLGDSLEFGSGVIGLAPRAGSSTLDLTAGPVRLDATFGVLLVDDPDDIGGPSADPTDASTNVDKTDLDRFFVQAGPGGFLRLEDLSVALGGTDPQLVGQLGFVGVEGTLTDFTVAEVTPGADVLAVDVVGDTIALDGHDDVTDALRLTQLLFELPTRVDVTSSPAFTVSGGLGLAAKVGQPATTLASGAVTFSWADTSSTQPVVDATGLTALQAFNPLPNLFGTHDGATSTSVLVNPSASFPATAVGAQLRNLTDGSSCVVASVLADTLTCEGALAGSPGGGTANGANTWNTGDRYRLEIGDPLAMLTAILDGIETLAASVDAVSPGTGGDALDTNLPLVGASPRDLIGELRRLQTAASELRGGPAASITCGDTKGTSAAPLPTGTVSVLPQPGPNTVFCAVQTGKPATAATWSVVQGGSVTSQAAQLTGGPSPVAAPATVSPTPTANAQFSITAPQLYAADVPTGYRIRLDYTDEDGDHTVEFPVTGVPGTLQVLERTLQDRLALAEDELTLVSSDPGTGQVVDFQFDWDRAYTERVPLNVELSGLGGLASVGSAGGVDLALTADVDLDLRVPTDLSTPELLAGSVVLDADVAGAVGMNAAFGPLSVTLGTQAPAPSTGTLQLSPTFTLTTGTGPLTDATTFTDSSAALTFDPTDCGTVDTDGNPDTDPEAVAGDACGLLSVGFEGSHLGYAGFYLSGGSIHPVVSDDIADQLLSAMLDWDLLLRALSELIRELEASMDGTATGRKLPVVGDLLDGGADVAGTMAEALDAVIEAFDVAIEPGDGVGAASDAIQQAVFDALSPTGLLLDRVTDTPADGPNDVSVTTACSGFCSTAGELDDVSVSVRLGQIGSVRSPAFDIGLDGLPLRVGGAVEAEATWKLNLGLGISREKGPYLVVKPGEELTVDASVGLGAAPCAVLDPATITQLQAIGGDHLDSTRCLTGTLGFLGVDAWDHETSPTGLTLAGGVDLTAPSPKVGLTDLVGGALSADFRATGTANVDLLFRTSLRGQEAGFPSVVGNLGWDWNFDVANLSSPSAPAFTNLHLDIGAFAEDFIEPILEEVRNITSPLQPVIDTLNAPVPVVTQIAELAGQPPVTLLSIMTSSPVAGDNNLTVIQTLASVITFINQGLDVDGLIPLGNTGPGSFTIDPAKARQAQGPQTAASVIQAGYDAGTDLFAKDPALGAEANKADAPTKDGLPGTFGVPGLTFPFMEDAGQIFGVLMGQDATLVRFDFGTMEATAGFGYEFGPFFIGPVPVVAHINGSATIGGRLALGYDTTGLRKVLDGGSGVHLFDGIFIDDLDASGTDVPEVYLVGEVSAGAAVTVFIAKAGIEGGITLTVGLNLHDGPQVDGKLRIEEIVDKLANPICLFDVEGKLEAFLRLFLEINYFVGTERWDWELLRVTLLEFSGACEPPQPKLARLDGTTLTLLMGSQPNRTERGIATGQKNEKFTVRPVGGGRYAVEAFGVYQVFPAYGKPGSVTHVVAHGEDGNDTILLLPGATTDVVPGVPLDFTATSLVRGGSDNDTIVGGQRRDDIDGGSGNDKIDGSAGNDLLRGGPDHGGLVGDDTDLDTIDGGLGDDEIHGGQQADQLRGGAGDDDVFGGSGDDFLNGGPGTAGTGPTADLGDLLVGGSGRDNVEGGFGADEIFGDARYTGTFAQNCAQDGGESDSDADNLDGGDAADVIHGGGGPDVIVGGAGDDDLCGNGGDDTVDGDTSSPDPALPDGHDYVDGGADDDTLFGRSGHDVVRGGSGADVLEGGDGNDDLVGGTGRDVLRGGDGVDLLAGDTATITGSDSDGVATRPGTVTPDTLAALVTGGSSGSDASAIGNCDPATVSGNSGTADCLSGGPGADALFGEAGRDQLFGEAGTDFLSGGDDRDTERGGADDDVMHGDDGDDTMFGDSGHDRMFGDDDNDTMRGNAGDDHMEGNAGADHANGDGGQDDIIGGSDDRTAHDAAFDFADGRGPVGDTLIGGADDDVITGDNAHVEKATGTTDGGSKAREVTLHNVNSTDADLAGPDTIEGGHGTDRIFGQGDDDTISGGDHKDRIEGNAGVDTISGGDGNDLLVGGTTDLATLHDDAGAPVAHTAAGDAGDTINGNGGHDVIVGDDVSITWSGLTTMGVTAEGTYGDDHLHGDAGDDQIYGQLGGDELTGGQDHDYLVGDLGAITPATAGPARWPSNLVGELGAPKRAVQLIAPDVGGVDTISGDDGDDHAYGGAAGDSVEGGLGDDHLEGNGGQDSLYGLAPVPSGDELTALIFGVASDQDDILGGSSSVHPDAADPAGPGAQDEGELIVHGGPQQDVILGDNGEIVRETTDVGGDLVWAHDPNTLGNLRTVTLYDRERVDADLVFVSGADLVHGDGGSDRMFGEGGDDHLFGDGEDDFVQGNQGADLIEGNDGEDDLIGGTSFLSAAAPSSSGLGGLLGTSSTDPDLGDRDGGDFIYGGAGADVAIGDNGQIVRAPVLDPADFTYVTRQLGILNQRGITLYDLSGLHEGRFGADQLSGGADVDVLFGQDGDDYLSGGLEDDYLEGNGGSDRAWGDTHLEDVGPLTLPDEAKLSDPVIAVPALPAAHLALLHDGGEGKLHGSGLADGEDDLIGGSSIPGHRDSGDFLFGDGDTDFQLGDNGELLRSIVGATYVTYDAYNGATARQANRFDVGGPVGAFGGDYLQGDDGDDWQWGQDGNDALFGNAHDDDMYGELGDDRMFGGTGEDAMVGDRGAIVDHLVVAGEQVAIDTHGPTFLSYTGLRPGTLDRRVDLTVELDGLAMAFGDPMVSPGLTVGGDDFMRGGPDHDSMHGSFGDDLMNGDAGGDWLFGADGADVMWGGRGCDPAVDSSPDCTGQNARGDHDRYVDYLFGGHGSAPDKSVEAADILDFRPRSGLDPAAWFEITDTDDLEVADNQHHHGIDHIYGGYDRDVLQADVGKNGPDFGDRLLDWVGAFNLYTRCNASYGDDGDVRERSPQTEAFIEVWAFGSGIGQSLADLRDPSSSGYRELGLVYKSDTKANNGVAFPTTPGHFDQPSCLD